MAGKVPEVPATTVKLAQGCRGVTMIEAIRVALEEMPRKYELTVSAEELPSK